MVERITSQDQKIINILNDMNLYLKFLEQRIIKLELELKTLNENFEKYRKTVIEEIDKFKKENLFLKDLIDSLNLEIEKIKLELKKKADLAEVKEIKELLNLFNPLKSTFVTKEEVKRIVNELINIKKE
ncbi:MAG: hypothetical protein QXE43_00630 [Candidatus Aenigmatarchaeota archaeon]|nr:hypothetical protein [Candidatus Aenigmarchaeota archaeon]